MSDMAIGFSGLAAANDSDLYALLVSAVDGGGAPSLDQIISGCPRVLTAAWQSQSRVSDGALAALRAYRSGLDEGTRSWPWGAGPLEQLFEGLDRAFSLKAAQSLAASPLVTRSLRSSGDGRLREGGEAERAHHEHQKPRGRRRFPHPRLHRRLSCLGS